MRLYVANCTKQNAIVFYRLDIDKDGKREEAARSQVRAALQVRVGPQRQEPLGGDMHLNQVNSVIDQLARHGGIRLENVGDQRRHVAPYVLSVDRPVPANVMQRVIDDNAAILLHQGFIRRKKAAVAVDKIVKDAVESAAIAAGVEEPPEVPPVDVSFEQDEQSEAGEKVIEEGFRVDRDERAAQARARPAKPPSRRR